MRGALADESPGVESLPEETTAVLQDEGDIFWMPYAVAMSASRIISLLMPLSLASPHLRYDARLPTPQRKSGSFCIYADLYVVGQILQIREASHGVCAMLHLR